MSEENPPDTYSPATPEARAAIETLTIRDEPDAYAIISGCFDYIDKLVEFRASDIEVAPTSRISKVDRAISPYLLSHNAQRAITGATDHLVTIRHVMKTANTQTIYGPFTLLRGALESVAQGLYILGERNQQTMMTRVLQLECSDDANAKTFGRRISSQKRTTGRTQHIKAKAAEAGLRWKEVSDYIGYKAIVEAAGKAFELEDNLTIYWMLTSGIAHNKQWAVVAMTDRIQLEESRDTVGATFTLTSNTAHIANALRFTCMATDILINTYSRQVQAKTDIPKIAYARSYHNVNQFIAPYRSTDSKTQTN